MVKEIKLKINGSMYVLSVNSNQTLAEVLRDHSFLNLTGTKIGCNQGECGACTVLLNGKPILSCLMLAMTADGEDIVTIEGLSPKENPNSLSDIQQAFIDCGAVQCGFCTPGMIMSATALLKENPNPSDDDIKEALAGNLCRCTGYKQIIEAVKAAAIKINKRKQI
jgi:carbon-monoxide dehydrogenase small subunit